MNRIIPKIGNKYKNYTVSLDRIDSSKGYTKNNIA